MLNPNRVNPSALIYYRTHQPVPFQAKVPAIAAAFRPLVAALQQRGYEAHAIGDQFEEDVTERLWKIVTRHYPDEGAPDAALDDFRKHRQYGLQCAAALSNAAQNLPNRAQAILRESIARIACTSSWEATALAGALSIDVRKKSSALTFEHYPSLVGLDDAGQTLGARLAEFCRRTTKQAGNSSSGTGASGLAADVVKLQAWADSNKRSLLIVVGGTDRFGMEEDAILKALRPSRSLNVILTRTDANGSKPGFDHAQWSKRELAAFVVAYLARNRKALDSEDLDALLAHPLASDLSYLRFVCDWLVTFASFETVSGALHQCLRVEKFVDLAGLLKLKGQEEIGDDSWLKIAKATLANERGCVEADLIAGTGSSAVEVYSGLSILSPMLEIWSGRIWRHHGRDWDALAKALLDG